MIPADIPDIPLSHDAVRDAVTTRGVARVRGAYLAPGDLVDFLRGFGPLMFTTGERPVPDHPDLNVVTNRGRSTRPRSVFHSDTTYVARPPSITALMAVEVPDRGGATLFTDQYAAWDALTADRRRALEGARVRHRVTGVDLPEDAEHESWHPFVRTHPVTGRRSLFLTTPARMVEARDAAGRDMTDQLPALYDAAIRSPARHAWSPGDVVFWDNRCTLHAADHSAVVGNRTLYRGMVQGEVPVS